MTINPGDTGHVTEHNRLATSVDRDAFAIVDYSGTNAIARQTSNGGIISQGTSPATVINAALTAAGANANGGAVKLASVSMPIDAPIVGPAKTALVGNGGFSRTGNTAFGSVLKSNGLGSGDAVVQSGGDGFFIEGLAVHANNQAGRAFAHLAGADVQVRKSALLFATDSNLYHAPAAGGYAFILRDSILWGSGNYGVNIASGTDGRILNCGVFQSALICCSIRAGGWILMGCHITHSSALTTTVNTEIAGSTCVVTGNYFDSCKNGPTVRLASSGTNFVGNRVYNDSSNNGGTLAIALDSAFGSHVQGNTTHTNGGTGMQWRSGSLPVSGVYGPNFHLNATKGYVDASGNAVAVQTTATLYVGPNLTS